MKSAAAQAAEHASEMTKSAAAIMEKLNPVLQALHGDGASNGEMSAAARHESETSLFSMSKGHEAMDLKRLYEAYEQLAGRLNRLAASAATYIDKVAGWFSTVRLLIYCQRNQTAVGVLRC